MNEILLIILLALLIFISGRSGFKLFISIILNFIIVLLCFILISLKLNAIIVSFICCIAITYVIIYMVTDNDIKRRISVISTIFTLIILVTFIYVFTIVSKTYGFGYESFEEINMFSYNININMIDVEVSLILIGLIGAIIDSSVSVCSSMYEIYLNNKSLKQKELFKSGINVGGDILGTTVNTLLFAFLGESITLLIWLYGFNYSFLELVNNKTLVSEIFKIIFSSMSSLLVIPFTAYISSYMITTNKSLFSIIKDKLKGVVG